MQVHRANPLLIALVGTMLLFHAAPAIAQLEVDTVPSSTMVSGTVYDSLSGRPLAGALVQLTAGDLHGRVSSDRTDLLGNFSIGDVKPGDYIIGFTHPFLDSLGLEVPPRRLHLDGTASPTISLATPRPPSVLAQLCPAAGPSDSTGLMLGFLRDADTGAHLDGGTVILEWVEVRVTDDKKAITPVRRSLKVDADARGWYAICGIPTAGPVAAYAEGANSRTGSIDVRVPPRGILHRDFNIPRGAAAVTVADATPDSGSDSTKESGTRTTPARSGRARVAGTVRDRSGKPLGGARVMVWGTDVAANARDDGTFVLDKLPSGTQTLEARHIGYAARRVVVDLSSHRTDSVTVMLDKIADVLGEVTVYGEPSALSRKLEGFRQRMRAGWGRFFTRADIQKRAPMRFTDMLRGIPGIAVRPVGAFGYQLASSIPSSHCAPTIVVDGHQLPRFLTGDYDDLNSYIWLDQVVGIEVYSHGTGAPAEFGGWGFCPVVLVWTSPDADIFDHADRGK
jgi:hypothetical protein